jgi:hypothetical protein
MNEKSKEKLEQAQEFARVRRDSDCDWDYIAELLDDVIIEEV